MSEDYIHRCRYCECCGLLLDDQGYHIHVKKPDPKAALEPNEKVLKKECPKKGEGVEGDNS